MTKEEQKEELKIVDSLFKKIIYSTIQATDPELQILATMMNDQLEKYDKDAFEEFFGVKVDK